MAGNSIDASKIVVGMDLEEQERMYPFIYDAALRRLRGEPTSEVENECIRKWIEVVEDYRLLIDPETQDAWLEFEYGFGDREDLKLVIAESKKRDLHRKAVQDFGLEIDVSDAELAALKIIDDVSGPIPIDDNRLLPKLFRDYFEAKAKNRDSLFAICEKLCESLKFYEKNDYRGMVIASLVRDCDYLENGPNERLIQRIRHKYDHLTDRAPEYANLVVNYCHELGVLPKVRDVMLLHTPATYGMTKKKFAEVFPRAETTLEDMFALMNSQVEGGIVSDAIKDAMKKGFRKTPNVFVAIWPWSLGKSWLDKSYGQRMCVWALEWPHGKIESTNEILYAKLKEFI